MDNEDIIREYEDKLRIYNGILFNNQEFKSDYSEALTYDFNCKEYEVLKNTYNIAQIAGEGTKFQQSLKLMAYFAPKLTHKSDYDNHIKCDSLSLLEYSFNNPEQGINCRNKSKILQECCLALGIYCRRMWLMPYSPYDYDNHVVNEIYDFDLQKWIMIDITLNGYFQDENQTPLSVLELRNRFALNKPCTLVILDEEQIEEDQKSVVQIYYGAYYSKNLFYLIAEKHNGFGVSEGARFLSVLPLNFNDNMQSEMNKAFRAKTEFTFKKDLVPSKSLDIACLTSKPV